MGGMMDAPERQDFWGKSPDWAVAVPRPDNSMRWFLNSKHRPGHSVRLYCLPYAGAGATAFATWGSAFPPEIAVTGVQPPGKGWRLEEPPVPDLAALADQISSAIRDENQGPFALFGHSMGAWVALEVTRRLEAVGLRPRYLLVSGRQAPSVGHIQSPIGHLPDAAFVEAVGTRYGSLPPDVMANPEVLEAFLPSLRADFLALERFQPIVGSPIQAPIIAYLGESDPHVAADHILPWGEETQGAFSHRLLPGGHFYFQDDPKVLPREVAKILLAAPAIPPFFS